MTRPIGFRSLRWRLTALIGCLILLAVGATFIAIYRGTGTQLRLEIDRELRTDAAAFDREGVPAGPASAAEIERSARAYLSAQPFGPAARLLIARVDGLPPVSNQPELVAPRRDAGESPLRQSREARAARAVLGARLGFSNVTLDEGARLRLFRQTVVRRGRPVATVAVGESLTPVSRAQHQVARTFALAGSITLLVALLAGYLVAARTARPLRRMARVAERVDGGDLSPRMTASGPRDEVRLLAETFDRMLDRLEDAFARQRAFASDASHELRTPLTVIRGQLEVLARQSDPSPEDIRRVERLVRTEVLRMERLVEDLLALARADEREFLQPRDIDIGAFAAELVDGLRTTANRRFELAGRPEGTLTVDPDRLAQALRNLLANAIDHTTAGGLVRLVVLPHGDRVTLAVEDDGPGIPAEQRDRVFDRFHRTDSARTRMRGGTGLGLAIARAVVEAHHGTITAGESPEGGARVAIELPGYVLATAGRYAPAVSSSS